MHSSTQNSKLRTRNLFWPLVIFTLGLIALLQALQVFPPAVADLLGRSWPLILVLIGLAAGLGEVRQLKRWSWLIALVLSAALIAGIAFAAYTTRAATERADNTVTFQQGVGEDVNRLRVVIEGLQTSAEISPSVTDSRAIDAEFVGSVESVIDTDYTVEGGTATFTLRETRPNAIPFLEAVGRGRLNVELPPGVPVELDFRTAEGTVSLNLLGLDVVRLNTILSRGELLLSLPETALEARGTVTVDGGSVSIFVPDQVGLHLHATGSRPEFVEGDYLVDPDDGSYLPRNFDSLPVQMELSLVAPGGTIRVE